MPHAERYVCVSVHDVAPSTWPLCEKLIAMLDRIGPVPLTLLVVPDYHRRGCIDQHPDFLRHIERRLARGDEVALHGYYHLDEGGPPQRAKDWIERRVLTNREGEFAPLSQPQAHARLDRGCALMQRLGWPVTGFVAPAWLLGEGARFALPRFAFHYTTTRGGIYRLPDWDFAPSPAVSYSARSGWRRALSAGFVTAQAAVLRHRLLRLALHPVDARFDNVVERWDRVVTGTLQTRVPITKAQWIGIQSMPQALGSTA
jgi:uncharacterized protein